MNLKLGDLVVGVFRGQHYLGQITRLNGVGPAPSEKTIFPHAITWFKHWTNAIYTPYTNADLETIAALKNQFNEWRENDFK